MKKDIFLWPSPRPVRFTDFIGPSISTEDIESHLKQLYPDCYPVLFSSARAGILATLKQLGLGRPDLVWCPPYSSHCIFDAVSRICTPITVTAPSPHAALVYHQWGHVHTHDFPPTTTIIEDAVDTLFVPGNPPFAIDGRYVLWSLPKVIASHWGGVVFCRHSKDATELRRLRDSSLLPGITQTWLRVLGECHPVAAAYWHGVEANGCKLPSFALRQIQELLYCLPDEVVARRSRMAPLLPFSLAPVSIDKRLPANLPLPSDPAFLNRFTSGQRLCAGFRNFNLDCRAPDGRWSKVTPIPIHQDINGTDIAEILARVSL